MQHHVRDSAAENEPVFESRSKVGEAAPRASDASRSFRPAPARADQAPTADYLEQDVWRFFYRWGGLLSSTLIRIRSRFDGDLDQYLLYLIFLLAELAQITARADAEARGHRPQPERRRGMNALSLSDITRVPRETTRRKLQLLVEHGYLTRGETGLYYLGDSYGLDAFFADLSPLFWDGVKVEGR
ncbi:MAG TPA: hypothetical protein VHZ26_13320 [Caulobacteraceae bacterium]|jgi:hypothetical protein|nr:hypothetical protein [Caulobacteraceae bacterium]